jgi:hypothetical protein
MAPRGYLYWFIAAGYYCNLPPAGTVAHSATAIPSPSAKALPLPRPAAATHPSRVEVVVTVEAVDHRGTLFVREERSHLHLSAQTFFLELRLEAAHFLLLCENGLGVRLRLIKQLIKLDSLHCQRGSKLGCFFDMLLLHVGQFPGLLLGEIGEPRRIKGVWAHAAPSASAHPSSKSTPLGFCI